jgi:hypothetical protein
MKMNGISWSALAVLLVVCHVTFAAPSARVKRQDELSLDPVSADVSLHKLTNETQGAS